MSTTATSRGVLLRAACCAVCASFGCEPRRVDLGNAPTSSAEGNLADAGPAAREASGPDGGDAGSDGSPSGVLGEAGALAVRLRAWGRDVVRLEACTGGCIPVSLSIEGGVPPYQVRWDDGNPNPERMLCVDPSRPRSVAVQDASHGRTPPASLALPAIGYARDGCSQGWTLCQQPSLTQDDCSGPSLRSWSVEHSIEPGTDFIASALAPPESAGASYGVWISDQACQASGSLDSAYVYLAAPNQALATLELGPTQVAATWSHLVLTSTTSSGLLGPLGPHATFEPPESLRAFELCELGVTAE